MKLRTLMGLATYYYYSGMGELNLPSFPSFPSLPSAPAAPVLLPPPVLPSVPTPPAAPPSAPAVNTNSHYTLSSTFWGILLSLGLTFCVDSLCRKTVSFARRTNQSANPTQETPTDVSKPTSNTGLK